MLVIALPNSRNPRNRSADMGSPRRPGETCVGIANASAAMRRAAPSTTTSQTARRGRGSRGAAMSAEPRCTQRRLRSFCGPSFARRCQHASRATRAGQAVNVDGSKSKMSGHAGTISADIMRSVATTQTNGSPERLSPERLAELKRPATAKTPEEKRAALKRATEGLRVKVRVTPDMYGRR